MNIIDRRLNPGGKSLPNRQRFLRRVRGLLREAVRTASTTRKIRELEEDGLVIIPAAGIEEPSFHLGHGGDRSVVFPGNKEFMEGDKIKRPEGGGANGGAGSQSGDGGGETTHCIAISADEFLDLFLDDLELPDLERKALISTQQVGIRRAGYSTTGSPANLSIGRTLRNANSRRIALHRPTNQQIALLEAQVAENPELDTPRSMLDALRRRRQSISWIDPIDLRYRRFTPEIKPTTQAVMFCLMDVSGSMSDHMKDLARRFYMLLHVFLKRRYRTVEIIFIRHTDTAREVDEETFFNTSESGGTRVSSALSLMKDIAMERYPRDSWNLYVAQSSDGDNDPGDNLKARQILADVILPMVQYCAYLEVGEYGRSFGLSSLWKAYDELNHPKLAKRSVSSRADIFPVFRDLFPRTGARTEARV